MYNHPQVPTPTAGTNEGHTQADFAEEGAEEPEEEGHEEAHEHTKTGIPNFKVCSACAGNTP